MIDRELPVTPMGAGYDVLRTAPNAEVAGATAPIRRHLVFVYGSLRQGFGNYRHYLEGKADFVGMGQTLPEYTMLNLGAYPGVVAGGTSSIVGEIFGVDDVVLKSLDRLEGHPSFYRRTPITLEDGRAVEMYILDSGWNASADARNVVATGDWRRR